MVDVDPGPENREYVKEALTLTFRNPGHVSVVGSSSLLKSFEPMESCYCFNNRWAFHHPILWRDWRSCKWFWGLSDRGAFFQVLSGRHVVQVNDHNHGFAGFSWSSAKPASGSERLESMKVWLSWPNAGCMGMGMVTFLFQDILDNSWWSPESLRRCRITINQGEEVLNCSANYKLIKGVLLKTFFHGGTQHTIKCWFVRRPEPDILLCVLTW